MAFLEGGFGGDFVAHHTTPLHSTCLYLRVDGRQEERRLDVLLPLHEAQGEVPALALEVRTLRAHGHAVAVHAVGWSRWGVGGKGVRGVGWVGYFGGVGAAAARKKVAITYMRGHVDLLSSIVVS